MSNLIEAFADEPDIALHLSEALEAFCLSEKLTPDSADALLTFNVDLTPAQRAWLEAFELLWTATLELPS